MTTAVARRASPILASMVVLVFPAGARSQVTNPSNGHVYMLTSASTTIQSARAEAAAAGGYLVAINDAAEQAWLVSTFPGQILFIGLSDEISEGTYLWDSGEPFAFSAWCPGEPTNGPFVDEAFAMMSYSARAGVGTTEAAGVSAVRHPSTGSSRSPDRRRSYSWGQGAAKRGPIPP